jgi:hypothetical protein
MSRALALAGFQRSMGQKGVQPVRFVGINADDDRIGLE